MWFVFRRPRGLLRAQESQRVVCRPAFPRAYLTTKASQFGEKFFQRYFSSVLRSFPRHRVVEKDSGWRVVCVQKGVSAAGRPRQDLCRCHRVRRSSTWLQQALSTPAHGEDAEMHVSYTSHVLLDVNIVIICLRERNEECRFGV